MTPMYQPDDNPQFETLRAERRAQFGVTIAYIKERVGEGTEYANEVARAVLSPSGCYYELLEMPEEFAGALGSQAAHRLVAEDEALETLRRVEALTVAAARGDVTVKTLSLYVLYAGGSLKTRRHLFVCDLKSGQPPFAHGALQPGVVPRFFKLRIDAGPDALPQLPDGLTNGVLFFLAPHHRDDRRSLLATITRTRESLDLSARPASATMH